MSEDIVHECGVMALYALKGAAEQDVTPRIPRMLLDLQTRGQLAAGFSCYQPSRAELLSTHKGLGTVAEVLNASQPATLRSLLRDHSGVAAIAHTRYATTGADDVRYAQPFERRHARRWKWFAYAFNGTLSNYPELREHLVDRGYHFTLDNDTEIIMHTLAHGLAGDQLPPLERVMESIATEFDGAYVIAFLDALGRMFIARDPLGMRPMNWAVADGIFAAASESVALSNAGFSDIRALAPGEMLIVDGENIRLHRFAPQGKLARCFFEWIYFSSVASEIDGAGVYASRAAAGRYLASVEDQPCSDDAIVVPVPDTAKAAADSYAFALGMPCMEGIIRNRYVGRTFIQPKTLRGSGATSKYTPLPTVLAGKRVFLVDDSIVRSTTLQVLVRQLREVGGAKEVHVRVACPPIIAPCFYGIDMSTLTELFAATYVDANGGKLTAEGLARMVEALDIDSLRFLPVDALGGIIGGEQDSLCLGCVTGHYPTPAGRQLIALARKHAELGQTDRLLGKPRS